MGLAVDLYVDLIKMPPPLPEAAHSPVPANIGGKHQPETVPPQLHRLMAEVDPPLKQQILDVSKREKETACKA